ALSIPTGAGNLGQLVKEHWPLLKDVTSKEVLAFARKQQREMRVFAVRPDDELWEAIEVERGGARGAPAAQGIAELKAEEWAIFSNPASARRTDNFRLREERLPGGYERFFERVVLVERLRVVKALIGFTRIVSPGDFA